MTPRQSVMLSDANLTLALLAICASTASSPATELLRFIGLGEALLLTSLGLGADPFSINVAYHFSFRPPGE